MKVLCIKYFQHISKIIQIVQSGQDRTLNFLKSQVKFQNRPRFPTQQLLQKELLNLKSNVENLLQYCQNLQNQNKKLKKGYSCSNQISQRNSYVIGQNLHGLQKNNCLPKQFPPQIKKEAFQSIVKQSEQLRKTRQVYLGSLNKIHSLKNQVLDLTQRLNSLNEIYEKRELDQTDDSLKKDMFLTENSLLPFSSKCNSDRLAQIDLEYLLCHEELSIDESCLKQNSSLKAKDEQNAVVSLIAKGISFRETKTLRSDQFKYLNSIVEKYLQQSQYHPKPLNIKKQNNCMYR